MELNDKLLALRTNNGYTTRDLAHKLNVSQSSISLWEKGERRPDMDKLKKLSALYGVSIDYLLGTNNDKDIRNNYFNKLNEIRNNIEIEISMLQKKETNIEKKITSIMRDINIDSQYRDKLSQDFSKDKSSNEHLITLISDKITEEEFILQSLRQQLAQIKNEMEKNIFEMKHIYEKLKQEQKKEEHLTQTLDLLEKKDFKNIVIENEYELKIIILKYLEIYEIFKNTDISIDELIIRIKSMIKNNLFL